MARYIAACMDWIMELLVQAFLEQIWHDKSFLDFIVYDKSFLFTSKFWFALYFYLKIKQNLNIIFASQTNGLTERQNQTLK